MAEPTTEEMSAAFDRALGPVTPRRVQTTEEWEAEQQQAERGQERMFWAGYATEREMDGAAADAWYGRDGA